jgi:hypothetical protein
VVSAQGSLANHRFTSFGHLCAENPSRVLWTELSTKRRTDHILARDSLTEGIPAVASPKNPPLHGAELDRAVSSWDDFAAGLGGDG